MKTSTARRLVALGLGAALVLTGCSSGDEEETTSKPAAEATSSPEDLEILQSIKVNGDLGEAPELEFDTPLSVTDTAALVIDEGDGDEIDESQTISFHSVTYSGATGEIQDGLNTFGQEPESLPLDPQQVAPALLDILVGEKVGTRFLFANPYLEEENTLILAIEVVDTKETPKPLDKAAGEEVTPEDGLPTVTLDDSGKPSIEIPEGYEEPDDMIVQPLIEGEGEVVEPTQAITAHYTGWKLDGTVFDSSWERGEPTTFPLTGVIKGWTDGLSGQTVGSQVLLVIPPKLAYGDSENELKDDTLIFVVDILAAS